MPLAHDWFIVELKEAHLGWGVHRNTSTRPLISGEAYIPIPKHIAKAFSIYNSNMPNNPLPLYNCVSNDGLYNGELLA